VSRCAAGSARGAARQQQVEQRVRAFPRCSSPAGLGAKRVTRCRSRPGVNRRRAHLRPWYGKHGSQQSARARRAAIEFAAGGFDVHQPRTRIARPRDAAASASCCCTARRRADEPNPQVKVTTNMGEFVIEVRQGPLRPHRGELPALRARGLLLRHRDPPRGSPTSSSRAAGTMPPATLSGRRTKTCSTSPATAAEQARHRGHGTRGCAPTPATRSSTSTWSTIRTWIRSRPAGATRCSAAIVQGMDVIDHIGETPTGSSDHSSPIAPLKPGHHREDGDGRGGCDQQRAGDNPAAAAAGHDPLAEVSAWRDCSSRTCIWMPAPPRPRSSSSGFLAGEAAAAEALYILGDLFEAWVGDDDQDPAKERVCRGLRALAARGVACFALHGKPRLPAR